MADNVAITAGSGTTIAADDISSVFYQRVKLSLGADGVAADAGVGQGVSSGGLRIAFPSDSTAHLGTIGGKSVRAAASLMTRPSDTTAYASGDLVANSTTAASVTPLSFTAARANDTTGVIRRAKIRKSGTSVTNAQFRLHLYAADPSASTGITNGDNGAWLTKEASYLGAIDITVDRVFSDFSTGNGVPINGSEITFAPASGTQTVYGLLEARAAYTPGNAETFLVTLEVFQD